MQSSCLYMIFRLWEMRPWKNWRLLEKFLALLSFIFQGCSVNYSTQDERLQYSFTVGTKFVCMHTLDFYMWPCWFTIVVWFMCSIGSLSNLRHFGAEMSRWWATLISLLLSCWSFNFLRMTLEQLFELLEVGTFCESF